MKLNWLPRAVPALLLSATLTGCARPPVDGQQLAAAERIGITAAQVHERQPDACGEDFPLLDVPLGQDKTVVWRRYEAYLVGTINPSRRACYEFNEKAR